MPKFSQSSLDKLATCHSELQIIFNEVIKSFDCTVLEGYRGEEAQNKAFSEGKSKLKWPNGKHNSNPSFAVDMAPYPIDFQDSDRIIYFAGFVMGIARRLKETGVIKHALRWGGDWRQSTQLKENQFNDRVHFEIVL